MDYYKKSNPETFYISDFLEQQLSVKLGKEAAIQLDKYADIVQFPSGHIILLEGERAEHIYFILSGVVRGCYIDEKGNDITKCFCAEHEFFSSEGFRKDSVSSFTIESVTDCKCIKVPYGLIRTLSENTPQLQKYIEGLLVEEISKLEEWDKNIRLMNAERRYDFFCQRYPDLYERVPLRHIASYIGIRPASLSRIRKHN